jgi:hypothetical protein
METENHQADRWKGFRIMSLGGGIALIGFVIAGHFVYSLGIFLFFVGWLVGIAGLAIHMKKAFRVDPKDSYPRTKQPWER